MPCPGITWALAAIGGLPGRPRPTALKSAFQLRSPGIRSALKLETRSYGSCSSGSPGALFKNAEVRPPWRSNKSECRWVGPGGQVGKAPPVILTSSRRATSRVCRIPARGNFYLGTLALFEEPEPETMAAPLEVLEDAHQERSACQTATSQSALPNRNRDFSETKCGCSEVPNERYTVALGKGPGTDDTGL